MRRAALVVVGTLCLSALVYGQETRGARADSAQGRRDRPPDERTRGARADSAPLARALSLLGYCEGFQLVGRSAGAMMTEEEIRVMRTDGEVSTYLRDSLLKKRVRLRDTLQEATAYLADKGPKGFLHLLIVKPSKPPTIAAIQKLLGEEQAKEMRGSLAGPDGASLVNMDAQPATIEWYHYGWLRFGVVKGKVVVAGAELGGPKAEPAREPEKADAADKLAVELAKVDSGKAITISDIQPINPRKNEREICVVKIEGGESIDSEHALLYTIFSPGLPEKLKELDPGLLKLVGVQIGAFTPDGKNGMVLGSESYTRAIPKDITLSLGENQSVTGSVGVRLQLWRLVDGKWQPLTKVSERTIELGKVEKPAVELTKVDVNRKDKGKYEATLVLKESLPENMKTACIRFLFVKADSGWSPKSATEIDATGAVEMRAAFPWCSVGGILRKLDKEVGFVLDLEPSKEWPSSAPKVIKVPLNASTLLGGMDRLLDEGKGRLYVAFVKYGQDGNTKVSLSNTVITPLISSVGAAEGAEKLPSTLKDPEPSKDGGALSPASVKQQTSWLVNHACIGKRYGYWNNTSPYEENMGTARCSISAVGGEELICVRFSLTAQTKDDTAINSLTRRREEISKTVPVFGDLLLVRAKDQAILTSAYRMFDSGGIELVLPDGSKMRKVQWVVEPQAEGYFAPGGGVQLGGVLVSTGGNPCAPPLYLARRTTSTFTGLLEVGHPVSLAVLFSIPKGITLTETKLRVFGQSAVPLELVDNTYKIQR